MFVAFERLIHNAHMPDELATRATLVLMGGIVAGLALGALVAWLWRSLSGARSGGNVGVAAGLALFGAGMAWVAVDMSQQAAGRSAAGELPHPGWRAPRDHWAGW